MMPSLPSCSEILRMANTYLVWSRELEKVGCVTLAKMTREVANKQLELFDAMVEVMIENENKEENL